jgi:2-amino-4-hydroxy-6-hydroxymethyldihydropteridine diphosphokinase
MLPDGLWIGLGGNQAGSESAIIQAIQRLSLAWKLRAVSSLYLTAPVDYLDQADFCNAVAWFDLPQAAGASLAKDYLNQLLSTELELGRVRQGAIPKGPRLIDLDLLLVGRIVMTSPSLTLPHPAMHLRRFVLDPLLEIDPQLSDPRSGRPYRDWQKNCQDQAIYSKRSLGYTARSV